MKSGFLGKIAAVAVAAMLAMGIMAGCASGGIAADEEQQANRAYMSQVNQTMEELGSDLDGFVDAVSRGDIVNMRTQAQNAYKTLDKLEALEAPEAMADIHESYLTGTSKLREALDEYITLYSDASSSSFDWDTYDKRIAEVQRLYDEGVDALKVADETAADKS